MERRKVGTKKKSPEGLAMLGVPGCRKYPNYNEISRLKLT